MRPILTSKYDASLVWWTTIYSSVVLNSYHLLSLQHHVEIYRWLCTCVWREWGL